MIETINDDKKIIYVKRNFQGFLINAKNNFIYYPDDFRLINWILKRLKKLLGRYFIRFKQNKVQLNQFMID